MITTAPSGPGENTTRRLASLGDAGFFALALGSSSSSDLLALAGGAITDTTSPTLNRSLGFLVLPSPSGGLNRASSSPPSTTAAFQSPRSTAISRSSSDTPVITAS